MGLEHRPVTFRDVGRVRAVDERERIVALLRQNQDAGEPGRPDSYEFRTRLGKLALVAGEAGEAQRHFRLAAERAEEPGPWAEAHYNALQAGLAGGRFGEAMADLRAVLAQDAARFAPFPPDEYEPLTILGHSTYLCRWQVQGNKVVIRELPAGEAGRTVAGIVFRQGIGLSQLDHPGIVRVRRWGYADARKTRPYVVCDYFESTSLADQVRTGGALGPSAARVLAGLVAGALRAAHARSVLHRGLGPSRVLLRRAGSGWEVRLTGFGLPPPAGEPLAYVPPERRVWPGADETGRAGDVYGWARVFCLALLGTPAPRADQMQALSPVLASLLRDCMVEDARRRPADFDAVLGRLAQVRQTSVAGGPPRLVVLRGLRRDAAYALHEGANILGRSGAELPPDIDLAQQESPGRAGVSPRHALVLWKDGMLSVTDLHSAEGTSVNRTRLTPGDEHPLEDQDVIEVGSVMLQVVMG
jgi:hypothetical protein